MRSGPLTKALLGAVLIGAGVSFLLAAAREQRGCVDCEEETPEQTATEVATASAELNGTEAIGD